MLKRRKTSPSEASFGLCQDINEGGRGVVVSMFDACVYVEETEEEASRARILLICEEGAMDGDRNSDRPPSLCSTLYNLLLHP